MPPMPIASTCPSSSRTSVRKRAVSPSVPIRSMMKRSPRMSVSTRLSRVLLPKLTLTTRFIPSTVRPSLRAGVALGEDAQAVEGQQRIDVRDRGRLRGDQRGVAARRDDRGPSAQLLAHPADHPIDLTGEAVQDPGLNRRDGVPGDDRRRPNDLNLAQLRGVLDEGVERNPDPGTDRPAQEVAVRGDRREGRGGAEVNDDRGTAVRRVRGDGVGDAVRADLGRVVVEDPHPGADARADLQRRAPEIGLAELPERRRERRDHARDRHRADVREVDAGVPAELLPEHGVLVGGAIPIGGDRPVCHAAAAAVERELNLGVPDVHGEQHAGDPPFQSAGQYRTEPAADSGVRLPGGMPAIRSVADRRAPVKARRPPRLRPKVAGRCYPARPGTPPSVRAVITERITASATTSGTAACTASQSDATSPLLRTKNVSPSSEVWDGETARARPVWASSASRVAWDFVSAASVATTPNVVWKPEPRPRPWAIRYAVVPANRPRSGSRAPARIRPLLTSTTSPNALVTTIAATTAPPATRVPQVPTPDFIAPRTPKSFPTIAPVPTPTHPSSTGPARAARQAAAPIAASGRVSALPMSRS